MHKSRICTPSIPLDVSETWQSHNYRPDLKPKYKKLSRKERRDHSHRHHKELTEPSHPQKLWKVRPRWPDLSPLTDGCPIAPPALLRRVTSSIQDAPWRPQPLL